MTEAGPHMSFHSWENTQSLAHGKCKFCLLEMLGFLILRLSTLRWVNPYMWDVDTEGRPCHVD